MIRSWCARYEAKHSYFKRLASYLGNFTNVAVSLAERHQKQICYLMSSQNGQATKKPLAKKPKIGNFKFVIVFQFPPIKMLFKI